MNEWGGGGEAFAEQELEDRLGRIHDIDDDTVTNASSNIFTIHKHKRSYLLKHDYHPHIDHDYFSNCKYYSSQGDIDISQSGYIYHTLFSTNASIPIGFWNETLNGWIIPPKYYPIIMQSLNPRSILIS